MHESKHGRRALWLFLALLLTAISVEAAVIHGTVYDLDLKPVRNSIVEINTVPHQRMVARGGNYEFSVPQGEYKIKAIYEEESGIQVVATESLTVNNEGTFVLDLVLFPDLEEEDEILQDIDVEFSPAEDERPKWVLYAVIITIFVIVLLLFFKLLSYMKHHSRMKKEKRIGQEKPSSAAEQEPDTAGGSLDVVVTILRRHEGRMTQKDLRKELPLSEAKVSLLIAELEHQGKIKKIKKGRGNILVLQ